MNGYAIDIKSYWKSSAYARRIQNSKLNSEKCMKWEKCNKKLIWWKVWLIPDSYDWKTDSHSLGPSKPNNTEKLRFDVVRRECVFVLCCVAFFWFSSVWEAFRIHCRKQEKCIILNLFLDFFFYFFERKTNTQNLIKLEYIL